MIQLKPETEKLLKERVHPQRYPDVDSVVKEALAALDESEQTHELWFKEEALKGFAALERGDYGRAPEEIEAEILRRHQEKESS